jgi:hypothetical protein
MGKTCFSPPDEMKRLQFALFPDMANLTTRSAHTKSIVKEEEGEKEVDEREGKWENEEKEADEREEEEVEEGGRKKGGGEEGAGSGDRGGGTRKREGKEAVRAIKMKKVKRKRTNIITE